MADMKLAGQLVRDARNEALEEAAQAHDTWAKACRDIVAETREGSGARATALAALGAHEQSAVEFRKMIIEEEED